MIKTYRQWIDNNFILKHPLHLHHQSTSRTLNSFVNKVIAPMFENFLRTYCSHIQKKDLTFPNLSITNHELEILDIPSEVQTLQTNYIYTIYTTPLNNHPFVVFGELNASFCHIIIPLGNRLGHIDINDVYPLIPYLTNIELEVMRQILIKCIVVRQKNMIYSPKYSIMNCGIINDCIRKINEIEHSTSITNEKKKQLIQATEVFYNDKIRVLLDRFFVILGSGEYNDALRFLKGEYNNYFEMNGLSSIFINSKELIGHLQIFINLFHLFHTLRDYKKV
jgi:hypothetical protein